MPPRGKRPAAAAAAEADAATAAEHKKFKSAMDEIADEYLCPITQELPIDPVIAEDGKIYEKSAIEEHIRARAGALKSPITNMPMGPRLLASTQVKNTIEKLVRSGAITGDKAEQWLQRLSDEELVKELTRKAESGDAMAMNDLCDYYTYGEHGLAIDYKAGNKWAAKAAALRDPSGMARAGGMLIDGIGVDKNVAHGVCLLTQAALTGSKYGACFLARAYDEGCGGTFPIDKAQAMFWYRKVATNTILDLHSNAIQKSAERVKELEARALLELFEAESLSLVN